MKFNRELLINKIFKCITNTYFHDMYYCDRLPYLEDEALNFKIMCQQQLLVDIMNQINSDLCDSFEMELTMLKPHIEASDLGYKVKIKIKPTVDFEVLVGQMIILGIWERN